MLIISTVLATVYSIYLACSFIGGAASSDISQAIAGAVATALVAPHMIMFSVGAVFGWIGVLAKKSLSALVAAILYAVGTLLFLAYAMFGVPILVLGFIGYANQKKINKKLLNTNIPEQQK